MRVASERGIRGQGEVNNVWGNLWRLRRALLLSVLAALWPTGALAVDLKLTGFGTVGYAQSDASARYLRYIDKDGTFKADSLAGVQAEAQFNTQWSATFQGVASAPRTRDDGYEAKVRWAFLSFRPTNDWLFRVGRLRPPFFIHSQNAEVGVTYDQVRLPQEVYAISPVFDFDGGSVIKTWALEGAEVNLDAYWGKSKINARLFQRDANLATYVPIDLESQGLVLSYGRDSLLLRGGAHQLIVKRQDGQPFVETFTPTTPFSPAPPPSGGTLFVPSGSPLEIKGSVLTLGADWRYDDWRITGEYARLNLEKSKIGTNTEAAYVTVARRTGKWTPYVTQARLHSKSDDLDLYESVNGTPVPLLAQGPPLSLPANFHRILADQMTVYDQYSTMLGASYSFSATSRLKFEWMQTKVGIVSKLFDGDIRDRRVNVYSVSYSVAF
jgi:hypothetical protein